jgi:hypothetical protein
MIKQKNYKTLTVNGIDVILPERIRLVLTFQNELYIVVLIGAKQGDIEDNENALTKENVHCYDFEGNLKWIYPWGITGMGKIDEDTVDLYDGSYSHYVRVATGDTIRSEFVK